MATFKITVRGKGIRKSTIDKIVDKLRKELKGKEEDIQAEVVKPPPTSRADRFAEAISLVYDAKSEFESLRDELQEWKDGMPENLQNSQKASDVEDAINELEECISTAEDLEGKEVNFPGMFG